MCDCSFTHCVFLLSAKVMYVQRCLVVTWLVPHETAAVSVHVLNTSYKYAPVYIVIRSHIRRMYVCLAVTCHLHLPLFSNTLYRHVYAVFYSFFYNDVTI